MDEKAGFLVSQEESIKTITFNNPKRRNALSPETARRAAEEVEKSAGDGTRVLIITGSGGSFSAGADLGADHFSQIETGVFPTEAEIDEMVGSTYHRLSRAVAEVPVPVIAAVDGVAAGFGCSLALLCDITLASSRAQFIEVFINISLIPDGGSTYILPKIVGMKKAMEMALTAEPVPAEEALRLGLVTRVHPPEELPGEAMAWARRLARGPVRSMALARKTFFDSQQMNLRDALETECRRQARLMTQPNFINAVQAFMQKKKPTFS
jgi:2-(1,2-epoxy-1,2-dihydrophenyl)acetyl-CoA isomerase